MRRDIKKRIFVFCLLLSVFLLAAVSFADGSRCRCDRLLNEDGRCAKCGEDPSLCSCSCWCGRSSRVIETGAGSILICEKCGSSCALCSCSDKQTAQRLEALSLEGKTVMNGLPRSGLVPQIVCGVTVLCAFALVLLTTKIVSLGSLAAALTVVVLSILFFAGEGNIFVVAALSIAMGIIVFAKHKDNIKRLIHGEEKKLTLGGKKNG